LSLPADDDIAVNTPAGVDLHLNDLRVVRLEWTTSAPLIKQLCARVASTPPRIIGDVRPALAALDARRPVDPTLVLHLFTSLSAMITITPTANNHNRTADAGHLEEGIGGAGAGDGERLALCVLGYVEAVLRGDCGAGESCAARARSLSYYDAPEPNQVQRGESTRLRAAGKKEPLKQMRWTLLRRSSRVRGRARQKLRALLSSKLATARVPWSEGKRPVTQTMMAFLARWTRRLRRKELLIFSALGYRS
jgi:hypothetical protein